MLLRRDCLVLLLWQVLHHRYTLHPPDDLEVVLPFRVTLKQFASQAFFNWNWAWNFKDKRFGYVKNTIRLARGRFRGAWELNLFPASAPELRRPVMMWARTLLIGHSLIIIVSCYLHLWMLPVVTTFAPIYGSWLLLLCNHTQHMGLRDNVSDFRLCCRTITLNPLVSFLYWQMNYHTEHHMYAAVPCYNLGRLHLLIKHDLPPCPDGLIATWRQIADIQKKQDADPAYQYQAQLPG